MKGLIPGELALVINARTPHGREHLVGKTVVLLERIVGPAQDSHVLGRTIVLSEPIIVWLIEADGYKNPAVELGFLEYPPGVALISERNLLPLDSDDELIEEFKRESDELLEKA